MLRCWMDLISLIWWTGYGVGVKLGITRGFTVGGQQVGCALPPRSVLPWSPVTDICLGSDQEGRERHSPALQVEHKEGGLGGSGAAAGWPFALTWPCVRPEALQVQSSAGSRRGRFHTGAF